MIDKKILISIVIVLLIGVAAASYQISSKTPGIWQPSVSQAETTVDQGSSEIPSSGLVQSGSQSSSSASSSSSQSGTGTTGGISPSDAYKIANGQNGDQQNTITSTPELTTLDGKKAYYSKFLSKTNPGEVVGEIYIDAQTGEILEGAGGAPNG